MYPALAAQPSTSPLPVSGEQKTSLEQPEGSLLTPAA